MRFQLKDINSGIPPQTFLLQEGDTILGRAPDCTIVLNGEKVSKKHCRLKASSDDLKIFDLNSSNGIYINGKKLASAVLKLRDKIQVGEYIFEIVDGGK